MVQQRGDVAWTGVGVYSRRADRLDGLRSSVGRGDDDQLRTGGSVVHVWERCVDRTVDSEDV